MKELSDIAWNVSESEYRADPALSYSILARYEREGFNGLPTLFDKVESPSLVFGSAVDTILTEGMDAFNERFYVGEGDAATETMVKVVENLHRICGGTYSRLGDIPVDNIVAAADNCGYQPRWKPETRAKAIRSQGAKLYKAMADADGRTVLDKETYDKVMACVDAVMANPETARYFTPPGPFGEERLHHQLKFKARLDGVDYRCMFDALEVNHATKTVQPVDLKTSHMREWDFAASFVKWGYQIQVRLYTRILKAVMAEDDVFKEYRILPFRNVVVCREDPVSLVWEIPWSEKEGTIHVGKHGQIQLRDPLVIGKELYEYLAHVHRVPIDVTEEAPNNITPFLLALG